jgi:pyrimidine-specific ribonucleoside hydrolase
MSEGHLYAWDEMAVIYLFQPGHFNFSLSLDAAHVMELSAMDTAQVGRTYLKLLGHTADFHLSPRRSLVFSAFPTDPSLFREDVAPLVKNIIVKHGEEEWKVCLLSNELHRHLGIYSLAGAKMGIGAREILVAPFYTLEVISFAGSHPQLS